MSQHYNQNYTREEIEAIVETFRKCILDDNFDIKLSDERTGNLEFYSDYPTNREQRKTLLCSICAEDFCHTLPSIHEKFKDETLYVFSPQWDLVDIFGQEEKVDMYVKIKLISKGFENFCIIISIHKCKRPMKQSDYLFRT